MGKEEEEKEESQDEKEGEKEEAQTDEMVPLRVTYPGL